MLCQWGLRGLTVRNTQDNGGVYIFRRILNTKHVSNGAIKMIDIIADVDRDGKFGSRCTEPPSSIADLKQLNS